MRLKHTTIVVTLKIRHNGEPADALASVRRALDVGSIQEDIEAAGDAADITTVVTEAEARVAS